MAVDILFFGGFKDGELLLDSVNAVANPYFGGAPAQMGTSGAKLAKTPDIIGVFKNSSVEDLLGDIKVAEVTPAGSYVTVVIWGTNKLKLFASGADANPFLVPPTGGGGVYARNNLLYVDATGMWDNANPGTDPSFLKVVNVVGSPAAPDALEVYQGGPLITA